MSSFPSDSVAAGRVLEPGIAAGTPSRPRHRRESDHQLGTTTFLIRELVRVRPVESRTRRFRLGNLLRLGAARPARGSPGGQDEWPCGHGPGPNQTQGAKESTCAKAELGRTGKRTR